MKASFFHLGAAQYYIEPYLRHLGLDVVVPPPTSQRTLDLGTRFCPEMVCAPCKIIFGNYVEALEAGADTLIMFGGKGTCRLGNLVGAQARLLREMGFAFRSYTFDLFHARAELLRLTRELANPSLPQLVEALRFLFALLRLTDWAEQRALWLRPRELKRGATTRARQQVLEAIAGLRDRADLSARRDDVVAPLRAVPHDPKRPVLRVALVGDPYSISEPFFNHGLEEELGRLGVEVDRWFWLSRSLGADPLRRWLGHDHGTAVRRASQPYLRRDVGGFARSTVGETVLRARGNYDGLIHLAPFSCTPEIMARNILLALKRDAHLPLLSLVFDEQTGHAGVITRLEAFVDVLRSRS